MPPSASRLTAASPAETPRNPVRPAGPSQPRLDARSIAGIGEMLRDYHKALLREPVPDGLATLVARLDRESRP